jgi:hypothetical protein
MNVSLSHSEEDKFVPDEITSQKSDLFNFSPVFIVPVTQHKSVYSLTEQPRSDINSLLPSPVLVTHLTTSCLYA